jgi:S1-C subfamily serine protease
VKTKVFHPHNQVSARQGCSLSQGISFVERSLTFSCYRMLIVTDFVDSMDESNYLAVDLSKPMGIVFEENDSENGGIFIQSLKPGGIAAENGLLQEGDQLIAVNSDKVSGLLFDDALAKILESEGETTKLTIFRGSAKQFYGATGPSQKWLDEFLAKGGVKSSTKADS